MKPGLRLKRIAVARKGPGFKQQLLSLAGRPVKTDEEQVEVDGQLVHYHDFFGKRTHKGGGAFGKLLVVAEPGPAGLVVALDTVTLPVFTFFLQRL